MSLARIAGVVVAGVRCARFALAVATGLLAIVFPHTLWRLARPGVPSPFAPPFFRWVCAAAGLRVSRSGAAPMEGPVLVVANHVSWTDVLVLGTVAPATFVAKADVRGWPLMGVLAAFNGTLFVDRLGRAGIARQVERVRTALARGRVVLFAEGTTSDGARVLPFRSALFEAADAAAVQPATLVYDAARGPRWTLTARAAFSYDGDKAFLPHFLQVIGGPPVRCEIVLHPPLPPSADRKALAARSREVVAGRLREAPEGVRSG